MIPTVKRFLDVAAAHLMLRTAPAVGGGYEQATTATLGMLLTAVAEEVERAAARRVEENCALRQLFSEAAAVVSDPDLGERLAAGARSEDPGLTVSLLEAANAELRGLLVELHAHVEALAGSEARSLEVAIWRELAESTVRRRLAIGPF